MEPCKKMNFSNVTLDELSQFTDELYRTRSIFTMTFEQLAVAFLSKALCQDFSVESFEVMRNAYLETAYYEKEEVPTEKGLFYKHIVNAFFNYDREPKELLAQAQTKASLQIAEIDARMALYQNEIDAIVLRNDRLESQEKKPVIQHYIERNQQAKDEIQEFLRDNIYGFVLNQCYADMRNSFVIPPLRYSYDWHPKWYEIVYPSMASNKFLDLPLKEYRAVIPLYENDREAFDKFVDDYIEGTGTIDSIRGAYTNSVVGTRWRIINEALQAYEAGYKIMFSAVCLSVVEGIVHDICLMVGLTENDIAGDGLQKKIDKIKSLVDLGLNYEYYVFKFRLIRNKVAHGTAEAEELQDIAGLLLLDLLDVINISASPRLPSNAKRFFLHQALEDKAPTNYEYAAGYVLLNKYEIPVFYNNVAVDHPKLLLLLQEDGFWSYVDSLINGEDDKKAIAFELLKRLKLLGVPSITNNCTKERFREASKTPISYNQEEYLKFMLQYGY